MEKEKVFQQLFSMSFTPMLVMNMDGDIQILNEACRHLLKRRRNDFFPVMYLKNQIAFLSKSMKWNR